MTNRLTLLTNSELFQEYNSIIGTEFVKRAELGVEIGLRIVDNKTKTEILSTMPHRDARRTEIEKASLMIAEQLSELDPELLWRLELTVAGKLNYMTVGEAYQVYKNNAKWSLV